MLQEGAEGLTLMVNGANDFVKANQPVVIGAGAAAAAFGAMAVGITTVTAATKIFNAVFAGTALANPALWGVIAITAGIAGGCGGYHIVGSASGKRARRSVQIGCRNADHGGKPWEY